MLMLMMMYSYWSVVGEGLDRSTYIELLDDGPAKIIFERFSSIDLHALDLPQSEVGFK